MHPVIARQAFSGPGQTKIGSGIQGERHRVLRNKSPIFVGQGIGCYVERIAHMAILMSGSPSIYLRIIQADNL
jgi:hypothetical protein